MASDELFLEVETMMFVIAELHAFNFMQDGECAGMSKDLTFDDCSAFGSISWAAKRLGMSKDQFLRKRDNLESEGFPKRDPLTNYYHKADVDAWIDHRRRIPDALTDAISGIKPRTEVDLDAI
ncbi:hypothetical protein [Roseovarius sp.]|uniref:hypothetical protein n=1 Tax=Roseovarius sp. TaxID=1486281 RepID=UPI003D1390DA